MPRDQAVLASTGTVALAGAACAAPGVPTPVAAVLGIALLAAPGWALAQVLVPRARGLESLAVTAGLALSVPAFGGLALFAAGVPLRRPAWIALLVVVTLAADAVLFARCRSDWAGWATGFRLRPPALHHRRRLAALAAAAAFAAAAVVAGGGVGLAGAARQHYRPFTQLWLTVPTGSPAVADLGVRSHEQRTARYLLVVERPGRAATFTRLSLRNGQSWHTSVPFRSAAGITAELYRFPDIGRPYRYVRATGAQG
jgi:uncharacterized membrane protein